MTNHTCGFEYWPRNINSRMDKNTRDAWLLQPTANVNALCLIHTSVKAVNKLHSSRIILDYLFQRTHSHWVPTDCELISLMYFPRGMSYEIIICKQFVAYFPFYLFIYFYVSLLYYGASPMVHQTCHSAMRAQIKNSTLRISLGVL